MVDNILNKTFAGSWSTRHLILQCRALKASHDWRLFWRPRESNKVAHFIVKVSLQRDIFFYFDCLRNFAFSQCYKSFVVSDCLVGRVFCSFRAPFCAIRAYFITNKSKILD